MPLKTVFNKQKKDNEMTEGNSKKSSWWQIAALIFTALLIVGLIVVNFFSENRFVITSSIVFLTCLLVVVVLSKSFDSFSLGFFSLKREVKENKEKIDKLENYVFQSINNNSNNNTMIIPSSINVQQMNSAEKEEEEALQREELQQAEKEELQREEPQQAEKEELQREEPQQENDRQRSRILNQETFKEFLLQKYMEQKNSSFVAVKDVKITDQMVGKDLISNRPITFKAYLKDAKTDKELFVDIFPSKSFAFFMSHDRIYVKVMKVFNYRSVKNTNAKMVCLIGELKSEEKARNSKLEDYFLPAISNNLLNILYINYTQEEYDNYVNKEKNKNDPKNPSNN